MLQRVEFNVRSRKFLMGVAFALVVFAVATATSLIVTSQVNAHHGRGYGLGYGWSGTLSDARVDYWVTLGVLTESQGTEIKDWSGDAPDVLSELNTRVYSALLDGTYTRLLSGGVAASIATSLGVSESAVTSTYSTTSDNTAVTRWTFYSAWATALGVDVTELRVAYQRAKLEARIAELEMTYVERQIARIDDLAAQGIITSSEATQLENWLNATPDVLESIGYGGYGYYGKRGFGGYGKRGWGGSRGYYGYSTPTVYY